MISLFVIRSSVEGKDTRKTIESFDELVDDVWVLNTLRDVRSKERYCDWYGVIYDNEYIDEYLKEGLKVFVEQSDADVLVLMLKKGDKIYRTPRLFRSYVQIQKDSLLPEQQGLKFETVLNGWVLSDDIG